MRLCSKLVFVACCLSLMPARSPHAGGSSSWTVAWLSLIRYCFACVHFAASHTPAVPQFKGGTAQHAHRASTSVMLYPASLRLITTHRKNARSLLCPAHTAHGSKQVAHHDTMHPLFQQDPAAFFAEGCEADVLLVLEEQRSSDALSSKAPVKTISIQPVDAAACAGEAAATDADSPAAGQPVQDASRPAPAAAAASLTAVRMRANRMLLSVWSPVLKASIDKAALQQQEQEHVVPAAAQEQLHEGWEKLATGAGKPPPPYPADVAAVTAPTNSSDTSSSSSSHQDASPLQQPKAQHKEPQPTEQQRKLLEVRLSTSGVEERHAWWLALCLIHPLSPTFGRPPAALLTPQLLMPLVDIGRRYAMPGLLLAAKGLLLEQGTQFGLGGLAPGQLDAAEWLVTADSIPGYEKVVTRCIEEVVRDCTLPPSPPASAASSGTQAAGPQAAASAATAAAGGSAAAVSSVQATAPHPCAHVMRDALREAQRILGSPGSGSPSSTAPSGLIAPPAAFSGAPPAAGVLFGSFSPAAADLASGPTLATPAFGSALGGTVLVTPMAPPAAAGSAAATPAAASGFGFGIPSSSAPAAATLSFGSALDGTALVTPMAPPAAAAAGGAAATTAATLGFGFGTAPANTAAAAAGSAAAAATSAPAAPTTGFQAFGAPSSSGLAAAGPGFGFGPPSSSAPAFATPAFGSAFGAPLVAPMAPPAGFGAFAVPSSSAAKTVFGAFSPPSSSAPTTAIPAFGAFSPPSSSAVAASTGGFGLFGDPTASLGLLFARPFGSSPAPPDVVGGAAPPKPGLVNGRSSAGGTVLCAAGAGGSRGVAGGGLSDVQQLKDIVKQLRPETAAQLAASLANCLMVAAGKARAGGGGDGGCEFKPTGLGGGWKCLSGGGSCSPMES